MFNSRLLLLVLALAFAQPLIYSQTESERSGPVCDQDRAIDLAEKQVESAAALEKSEKAIAVMVKGADLLWRYKEKKARAILTDAYAKAQRDYEAKGDQTRMDRGLAIPLPDQRFVVLSAIAKHDETWAKKLIDALPEYSDSSAGQNTAKDGASPGATKKELKRSSPADRIISLAMGLDPINHEGAMALVRSTFRYHVPYNFAAYLFKVSEKDRAATDALFLEALSNYSSGTIDDLLYLSPYAFGANRTIGPPRRGTAMYFAPAGFERAPQAEAAFLRVFFAVCSRELSAYQSPQSGLPYGTQVPDQVLSAMGSIEPIVAARYQELVPQITVLKSQAAAMMTDPARRRADAYVKTFSSGDRPPLERQFDQKLEELEKVVDTSRRNNQLIMLLMYNATEQPIEKLVTAAGKITEEVASRQMISWIYFANTQKLITEGALAEATKLAGKIEEIDVRATLLAQIAAQSLSMKSDRVQATEALEVAYAAAKSAPENEAKARTLLGLASLFTKVDRVRASEAMAAAIKTINTLQEPDLSTKFLTRRVETKTNTLFGGAAAPDFTIENSFARYGAEDFEGALWSAQKLDDKYLKAIAVLSLVDNCLRLGDVPKGKPRVPNAEAAAEGTRQE
jgi:hypothetical protein